jgi:hypothetical protein
MGNKEENKKYAFAFGGCSAAAGAVAGCCCCSPFALLQTIAK